MKLRGKRFLCVLGCAFALSLPMLAQNLAPKESSDSASIILEDSNNSSDSNLVSSADLPDSPGSAWLQAQSQPPQTVSSAPQQSSVEPQAQQKQDQAKKDQPVGTAAAEGPAVKGITAAEPAGVAMAPGKQRRVRTIIIKVGAIVGAGAAVGTVIALTAGTSSKPPGAR
jgi:cytoskeletal protein RodZ